MSKLAALLDELCPDGVEFRTLKEVCKEIIVPQRDRPKVFGGEIPWCRIEDIEGQLITGSKLGLGVTKDTIEGMNLRVCPEGTVLATCSASLGVVAIAAQPLVTNQTFIGLVCGEDLLNKYLYYFLFTQERKMKSIASTGTIPYISRKKFERLCVPVPPLEVQQEIVRVLDAFTDLEQSLVSELELRKKQYAFHRDELLNFTPNVDDLCPEGVEYRSLGEVGEFLRGSSLQKKHLISRGVPCIHYGQVYTRYGLSANETYSFLDPEFAAGKRTMTTGDLFIATTSENEEDLGKAVAWLGQEEVVASNDAFIYRHNLDPMYVSYFFASSYFHDQKYPFITGAKVRRLSGESMAKILIPVPPLEVQQEIVAKLDTFSGLIQSLEQEINLRRTQYEFYRNELLSFASKED